MANVMKCNFQRGAGLYLCHRGRPWHGRPALREGWGRIPGGPCIREAQNAEGRSQSRPAKPPGSRARRVRGVGDPRLLSVSLPQAAAASVPWTSDGLGQAEGSCRGLGSLWGERKVFLPLDLACEHCGAPRLLLKCGKHSI